jgi:hypothetical protein
MQRANELHTPQASFIEPGMGVRANVVECMQAAFRSANDDLTTADGTREHGSFGEFGERNDNRLRVAHGCVPKMRG